MNFFLLNATSMAKPHAVQYLETELIQLHVDCAIITETWFTKNHLDCTVGIPNYNLFRRDRVAGRGGGVCAYIRSNIDCSVFQPVHDHSARPKSLEILWLECWHNNQRYLIACCYHPPKPKYHPKAFIEALTCDIEHINSTNHDAIIIIAGDFNQLDTSFLEDDHGLEQMVNNPTHCGHLIDKIFHSHPHHYMCTVFSSILKTKHKAALLTRDHDPPIDISSKRKVLLYDLRAHNIDRLRYNLGNFHWGELFKCNDIEQLYADFVKSVLSVIAVSVPVKTVVLRPKDPEFITPLVKSLLRQRNRLRRNGQIERADQLALKINSLINSHREASLDKLSTATTKELWASVAKTNNNSSNGNFLCSLLRDPETVNNYFASIATKDGYDCKELNCFRSLCANDDFDPVSNIEIERYLRTMRPTSAGCDGIPSWLLRNCSYELADIVTHILNCSFVTGRVPSPWLNALVTPVPKIAKPVRLCDYRPISVTPLLSRLAEKIIVRRWLFPAIPAEAICDQYAFRPTGSTTAALIHFTHYITSLLEHNQYVRCLMIDFTKAFDCVDHVLLLTKIAKLALPGYIVNWICSFLTGRGQQCKLNGVLSNVKHIGLSIVQGSGIGPTLYVIMKSDLHTLSESNNIFKYADDTTLLVPEKSDICLEMEFNNVKSWAAHNRLAINLNKTKELVFRRPKVQYFHLPPAIDSIEQLDCCKLLGVFFQSNLKADSHVNYILSQCTQRIYLLKMLRHQGMPSDQLATVAYSLIVTRILYALPAWGGFLSVELCHRIDAFFRRIKRYGFTHLTITVSDLLYDSGRNLFRKICSPGHSLHHLLPKHRSSTALRDRGHPFELPDYSTTLHKKSFIISALYNFI